MQAKQSENTVSLNPTWSPSSPLPAPAIADVFLVTKSQHRYIALPCASTQITTIANHAENRGTFCNQILGSSLVCAIEDLERGRVTMTGQLSLFQYFCQRVQVSALDDYVVVKANVLTRLFGKPLKEGREKPKRRISVAKVNFGGRLAPASSFSL
jgi:hypothetical protein